MRAVLDTNVLISYLLTHRGPIARVIDVHLAQEHFVLLMAPVLLKELEWVLAYPKVRRYVEETQRKRFVALIMELSEVLELPASVPEISRDRADDWVIACAVVGRAHVIVSGDRDLLSLERVGAVPILSARHFLELLESKSEASDRA
jgi:putative PIN family toxin of toxin-antitoxin system